MKRLKTLRHPSVLTYVHSVETDKSVLLATEPVAPLQEHLEQLVDRGPKRENYLAWGVFQVCRALAFLNNDAKLRHNNIHAASVFVTPAGDWKLAGLESVCAVDQVSNNYGKCFLLLSKIFRKIIKRIGQKIIVIR